MAATGTRLLSGWLGSRRRDLDGVRQRASDLVRIVASDDQLIETGALQGHAHALAGVVMDDGERLGVPGSDGSDHDDPGMPLPTMNPCTAPRASSSASTDATEVSGILRSPCRASAFSKAVRRSTRFSPSTIRPAIWHPHLVGPGYPSAWTLCLDYPTGRDGRPGGQERSSLCCIWLSGCQSQGKMSRWAERARRNPWARSARRQICGLASGAGLGGRPGATDDMPEQPAPPDAASVVGGSAQRIQNEIVCARSRQQLMRRSSTPSRRFAFPSPDRTIPARSLSLTVAMTGRSDAPRS